MLWFYKNKYIYNYNLDYQLNQFKSRWSGMLLYLLTQLFFKNKILKKYVYLLKIKNNFFIEENKKYIKIQLFFMKNQNNL